MGRKILVIKINRLYQRGMDDKVLYDSVRGVWRASKEKVKTVGTESNYISEPTEMR